jgi:hypothetical protein
MLPVVYIIRTMEDHAYPTFFQAAEETTCHVSRALIILNQPCSKNLLLSMSGKQPPGDAVRTAAPSSNRLYDSDSFDDE